MNEPLLRIVNLSTTLETASGPARAVDGVSFDLQAGESLAVVGESGCGKTMLALSLMGLVPQGKVEADELRFQGRRLLGLKTREWNRLRGRSMSMVFQEPMSALNPVLTIGDQVAEVFETHTDFRGRRARDAALDALRQVGLPSAASRLASYPHELSGGMRQRVCLAMAIALEPALVLADEPTTALDVTIQAQILSLFRRRVSERGGTLIMATHDLAAVGEVCSRVLVMYAGTVVEDLSVEDLWRGPLHPYTQGLVASLPKPRLSRTRPELVAIPGTVPALSAIPAGCAFHPRCPRAMDICRSRRPEILWTAHDHRVRCWLYAEETREVEA